VRILLTRAKLLRLEEESYLSLPSSPNRAEVEGIHAEIHDGVSCELLRAVGIKEVQYVLSTSISALWGFDDINPIHNRHDDHRVLSRSK
jgi:hypothetical protein